MSDRKDSDLSPEERAEQEEREHLQQFENNLPEDEYALYTRTEMAEKLIEIGFNPLGPYSNGNFFIMRKMGTGKRFYFQNPNKPNCTFVDRLRDLYNEQFPNSRSPGYILPSRNYQFGNLLF